MPTDIAVIVAGVAVMFLVFVGAMGWATFYTRNVRTPGASYFDGGK